MEKYNNLFNQDFYPTPNHVIDLMELNVKGKSILESALNVAPKRVIGSLFDENYTEI